MTRTVGQTLPDFKRNDHPSGFEHISQPAGRLLIRVERDIRRRLAQYADDMAFCRSPVERSAKREAIQEAVDQLRQLGVTVQPEAEAAMLGERVDA